MKWVQYSRHARGRDINLPAEVSARSVEGNTLIITPGHSYELTDEEWAHIQAEHKDIEGNFRSLSEVNPDAPAPKIDQPGDVDVLRDPRQPTPVGDLPLSGAPTATPTAKPRGR